MNQIHWDTAREELVLNHKTYKKCGESIAVELFDVMGAGIKVKELPKTVMISFMNGESVPLGDGLYQVKSPSPVYSSVNVGMDCALINLSIPKEYKTESFFERILVEAVESDIPFKWEECDGDVHLFYTQKVEDETIETFAWQMVEWQQKIEKIL